MNNKIIVITSWDDTTSLDIKICDLLERYNMKGTFFFINDWLNKKISREELFHISETHEIGAHTLNHVTLTEVDKDTAKYEINESKKLLENLLGKPINSFAYPKGMYTKDHARLVKDSNFLCARTTKPFHINHLCNPFEMNVSTWTYPHALFDIKSIIKLFNIYNKVILNPFIIKDWNKIGKKIFDVVSDIGGVFHIFGHAWQIEKINGWHKLNNIFEYISNRKNVEYLTMEEYMYAIMNKKIMVSNK